MEINQKSYLKLLEESFPGIQNNIIRWEGLGFSWESSKLFIKEDRGEVLSHVALMEYPMLIEGQWHRIGALHGICTQVAHQGQGLASKLIQEALEQAIERCEAVLLFTDIPAFYERLSFRQTQEYRFHLSFPHSKGSKPLQPVIAPQDNDLFLRCFRERVPLSNRLWVKDNGSIASFNAFFATYPNYWSLYYCQAIDGLISYEVKNKTLHLYDIVANKIPSLNLILEHLPTAIDDIYFYFSPELLSDQATPEPYLYDNGHLMVHGSWQLTHPFMMPPLSRC